MSLILAVGRIPTTISEWRQYRSMALVLMPGTEADSNFLCF
jgi:hypothetical protein